MNRFLANDNLSLEVINRQSNDKIVNVLRSYVQGMRDLDNAKKTYDIDKLNKNKHAIKLNESLEESLHKRFGVKFRIRLGTVDAAIYFSPHSYISPVSLGNEEYLTKLKDWFKNSDTNGIDLSDITEDSTLLAGLMNNAKKIQEQMTSGKKITVDEDKAYISGLKDVYAGVLTFDFYKLFVYGLTDDEIVGVMLHEIGHGFNSFSSLYLVANTVTTTMESLIAVKDDKDAIVDLVNNTFGIKSNSVEEMLYKLVKNVMIDNQYGYIITNNESMADQFVVRFGLAPEFASALAKLNNISLEKGDEREYPGYSTTEVILTFTLITLIFFIIPPFLPVIFGGLVVAGIVVAIILLLASSVSNTLGVNSGDHVSFRYDELFTRVDRMKKDLIRQLRIGRINKEDKGQILKEILYVESTLKSFKPYLTTSKFQKLIEYVTTTKDGIHMRDFIVGIESLIENDFHYQSEKFKTIKAK